MTTENTPSAIIPIDVHKTPAAKRPTSMFRMALPLVYAGLGVALGTLTGVGMAFILVPAGASAAANDLAPTAQVSQASPRSTLAEQTSQSAQPAAIMRVAEHESNSNVNVSRARAHSTSSAPSKSTMDEGQSNEKQLEPGNPAAEKDQSLPVTPNDAQPSKHAAHPVKVQPRTILASAPEVIPSLADDGQLASIDDAKSPGFYSEGDLRVADYDATTGTIQTSDGRTFVLGTTVRVSNATSWDDNNSSIHYRCDQEGTCTLQRPGAVAPNAKVI